MKVVDVSGVKFGKKKTLALIAGPCVIESRKICLEIARRLVKLAREENIPFVFKASYDKANRSSHKSFRGPGLEEGLDILAEIKETLSVPVLTDIHSVEEVDKAAEVVDILQIPAFLCRQTDLVVAAAGSGKAVNIKKGQFLAPEDMVNVVAKAESAGTNKIILTERGASFGYNNLVADMRSLLILREMGYPVVFDATHSVQRPGGAGSSSSGDARWAPALARAAVATGCDGIFMETHINPEKALSDKDNTVKLSLMRKIWRQLKEINEIIS